MPQLALSRLFGMTTLSGGHSRDTARQWEARVAVAESPTMAERAPAGPGAGKSGRNVPSPSPVNTAGRRAEGLAAVGHGGGGHSAPAGA